MDCTVKSRSRASRARRPRLYRPGLEQLEVRAQPGSILGADLGLSLAADTFAYEGVSKIDAVRPLRRQANTDEGSALVTPLLSETVHAGTSPGGVVSAAATATSDNTALPGSPSDVRKIAAVAPPVAKAASPGSLPPAVQTPVQRTTPVDARLEVTTDYEAHSWTLSGVPADTKAQIDWASFSGTVKQSTFASVAVSNDGQFVYMVGQQGNPTVGTDLIAAKISADGSSATFLTLTMSNLTLGTDIVVDNNGVAYVSGATRLHGTIDPMLARINADFTGFDWVSTIINPVVSGDLFNGLAIDSEGSELWVGGVWNSTQTAGHAEDVIAGKFSDLANPAGPQQDALSLLVFTHPSSANDIARSNSGDLMLAGTYSVPGTREPALFKIDEDFTNQQLAYYSLPGTSNDFSRLDVDPRGNFYATGRAALTTAATNVDLLVAKYNRDFEEQWSHQYNNPTDASKDFFGSAIVVEPRGDFYVAGRDTGDVFVAKFDRDGASITDSIKTGGTPVGSFTGVDGALGIDRMVTGELYVGGRASSPNFPVTPGAFATTYNNTPGDAFSMQVSNFA